MPEMFEILTWGLALLLVAAGVMVLQFSRASTSEQRPKLVRIGAVTLACCVLAAGILVFLQHRQVEDIHASEEAQAAADAAAAASSY